MIRCTLCKIERNSYQSLYFDIIEHEVARLIFASGFIVSNRLECIVRTIEISFDYIAKIIIAAIIEDLLVKVNRLMLNLIYLGIRLIYESHIESMSNHAELMIYY